MSYNINYIDVRKSSSIAENICGLYRVSGYVNGLEIKTFIDDDDIYEGFMNQCDKTKQSVKEILIEEYEQI